MANSFRNFMLSRTRFGNASGVMSIAGGKSGRLIMPRGFYEVIAIGGGGGGALTSNKQAGTYGSTLSGRFSVASGGGAASAKCRIELSESGIAEYVVGSAGYFAGWLGIDETSKGDDGGHTSFSVNGISVICPGGKGGKANASSKGAGGAGGASPTIIGACGTVQSGGGGSGNANYASSLSHGSRLSTTKGSVTVQVSKSSTAYYGQGGSANIYFDGFFSSENELTSGGADSVPGLIRLTYFGTVRPADWN